MNDVRDVLRRPIITEKSMLEAAEGKYTFAVDLKANKFQIRQAVEEMFGVRVDKVNTMRMLGKMRSMGRDEGRRSSWKKAVVTLASGEEIDFFEGMI